MTLNPINTNYATVSGAETKNKNNNKIIHYYYYYQSTVVAHRLSKLMITPKLPLSLVRNEYTTDSIAYKTGPHLN